MPSLNSIEKRFPWSFLGVLLGTVSLAIAIGFFYLSKQEDVTDLKFYVEDEHPLVELKEKFPDIKVLYNNEDILESEKEIKIIRIRLANDGRTILQSYFDQQLPFGLKFRKSAILAITPITSSGEYLRENLFREESEEDQQSGRLLLNKLIIEKGSRLSFKVYLLQERGLDSTEIEALGKISGMDKIPVVAFDPEAKAERKRERSTGEIIAIGIASGYFGMLGLLLTMIAIIWFFEHREKRTRKKQCREFLAENQDLTDEQKEVAKSYARGWQSFYLRTIKSLTSGDQALDVSDLIEKNIKRSSKLMPFGPFAIRSIRHMLPLRWDPAIFVVTDRMISLNEENKEVVLSLLKKCKEIEVEQADAGNG